MIIIINCYWRMVCCTIFCWFRLCSKVTLSGGFESCILARLNPAQSLPVAIPIKP